MNVERFKVRGDKVVWIIYIILMFISLIEVFSSMGKTVYEKREGDIIGMFFKHLLIIGIGFVVTYATHLIKYKVYSQLTKPAFGLSILLLGFTLLFGQFFGKGADRWIVLPVIGQFQPSEIVKYILILYVANELTVLKEGIKDKRNFLILVGKIILICALIFPENFSTAFLVFISCYVLIFVAGAKMKHWLWAVPVGALFLIGVFSVYKINPDLLERSGTWVNRIEAFFNNNPEELTQANTATMAISTGGLMGKGIGNTTQGRFLSESHNDFIFAIILEEGGVLYGAVVMLLYFILFYRSIKIAKNAKGDFGRYTAIGIGLVISLQAVLNMLVATGCIPVTGQTLPFISYGGTSFVISSVALGIMLNISAESKKSTPKEALETEQASEDETTLEKEEITLDSKKLVLDFDKTNLDNKKPTLENNSED